MNQFERHAKIRGALAEKEFLISRELEELLGVSKATIRRDLLEFEQQGILQRVHGGARVVSPVKDEGLDFKFFSASSSEEKVRIGKVAASLVEEGQTVLLGGGSTALEAARCLYDRSIQIITNSIPVANLFLDCHKTEVTLTGGYLYPRLGIQIGPVCERMVRSISADLAIMGIRGITADGLSDNNAQVVESVRAMMKAAHRVIIVADHFKFGRNAMIHVADLHDIHEIVSDRELAVEYRQLLENNGIRCLLA